MFWSLANLEMEVYLNPCETLTGHIQSPVIGHYSAILTLHNACICLKLTYSKLFHNCILSHIQNPVIFTKIHKLTYLKPDTYLEPSQRFKMEFFGKIVKNYNYFSKMLHLRSLTRFWICLSYLEPCVILAYHEPCYIQNHGIFRTHDILKTPSKHILAYSERWVTLACWEPCYIHNFAHIQNFGVFRTGGTSRDIQAYSIVIFIIELTFLFSL